MSNIKNILRYFFMSAWNNFFCYFPSYSVRYVILKYIYRSKLGACTIHRGVKFFSPWKLQVGNNTNIQMGSFIDCRGGVIIGDNVDITLYVKILSQYHDIQSSSYSTVSKSVIIDNYCVIGSFALLLPGAVMKEGAVLGSGSLLNKATEPYSLYCGNPAVFKKKRSALLAYNPIYRRPFH